MPCSIRSGSNLRLSASKWDRLPALVASTSACRVPRISSPRSAARSRRKTPPALSLGHVYDASTRSGVEGGRVVAEWRTFGVVANKLRMANPQVIATTARGGWFAICGVPRGDESSRGRARRRYDRRGDRPRAGARSRAPRAVRRQEGEHSRPTDGNRRRRRQRAANRRRAGHDLRHGSSRGPPTIAARSPSRELRAARSRCSFAPCATRRNSGQ